MSLPVPWNDIGDTPVIDIGDKFGVFKTLGATPIDQFKLLLASQVRSTPQNTHYVKNQAELETALGPDLIIPVNTSITVVIDQSFVLTKPFKKKQDSSFLLKSESSNVVLFYNGLGALIQMDGAEVGDRTVIKDITLQGNTLNNCFAIEDQSFVIVDFCVLQQFANLGFLKNTAVSWSGTLGFINRAGITFINCRAITIGDSGGDEFGASPNQTIFSFVSDIVMTVIFQNVSHFAPGVQSELLFVDPNIPTDSFFTVRDAGISTLNPESLFQKGVDITVTAVADNGSGKIRCTAVGHLQINNTYAVLKNFLFQSTYNKTALITVIDADTFDVEEIDFVADDPGTINRASLDSRSPMVSAESNPNQRDSMFIASVGLEVFGSEVQIVDLVQNAFAVIGSAAWQFDNLERFEPVVGEPVEGKLVALDVSTREYSVKYSGTLEKVAGGSLDIGIIILRNGAEIAFNPPHTVNTGKIQISGEDLIELSEGDTIQVAVKNYGSQATISISQISLVISKG